MARIHEAVVYSGTLCTRDAKQKVTILDLCCTVVYVPEANSFYYETEVTALPIYTPPGSILVACCMEDARPNYKVPRVVLHALLADKDTQRDR